MTALKGRQVDAFLADRPKDVTVALIYGRDQGLIHERAKALGLSVVDDLNDPFNAIELTDTDLSEEGRLADEAAALSFMGGERLIRVRGSGDSVRKAVKRLLDRLKAGQLKPNALVVIEAGDLKPSNGLRKACEGSPHAAAMGCYPDNARDLASAIKEQLAEEKLTITDNALALLSARLGDDRGITRAEIEKLILYKGPRGSREAGQDTVDDTDVRISLTDSAADATFDVALHLLNGDLKALAEALHRAARADVSPLALLRILQGRLLRLLTAQTLASDGTPMNEAIKKVEPRVFFTEQRDFEAQLRKWPLRSLETAIQTLVSLDLESKQTGMPQRPMIERAFLRLCAQAARAA